MPRSNLTKNQRTVLKDLRGLEDEVILPVDKGNATMIMRRCDYHRKMEMLGTGTYGKLRGDPIANQENGLNHKRYVPNLTTPILTTPISSTPILSTPISSTPVGLLLL